MSMEGCSICVGGLKSNGQVCMCACVRVLVGVSRGGALTSLTSVSNYSRHLNCV